MATQVGLESYFNSLLSSQGAFPDRNLRERGGAKCNALAVYKRRPGLWQPISFSVPILSKPGALSSNLQSITEPSRIFLGIKPSFLFIKIYLFE